MQESEHRDAVLAGLYGTLPHPLGELVLGDFGSLTLELENLLNASCLDDLKVPFIARRARQMRGVVGHGQLIVERAGTMKRREMVILSLSTATTVE